MYSCYWCLGCASESVIWTLTDLETPLIHHGEIKYSCLQWMPCSNRLLSGSVSALRRAEKYTLQMAAIQYTEQHWKLTIKICLDFKRIPEQLKVLLWTVIVGWLITTTNNQWLVLIHLRMKEGNVLFNDALNTFYFTVIWRRTTHERHVNTQWKVSNAYDHHVQRHKPYNVFPSTR